MIYLLVKSLVLPPGLFILGLLAVWSLYGRLPRMAAVLLGVQILLLYLLSTGYAVMLAARWLEPSTALRDSDLQAFQPQAIVVLGAGRSKAAPEFSGRDTVGADLLVRLRYGAKLWRETGLPVLVTGGPGYDKREPEADLMARTLQQAFGVPVSWRERASMTTWENAAFSERILRDVGIERILLVTQAFHMLRSEESFARAGLQVLPVPTGFINGAEQRPLTFPMFLPSIAALETNTRMLHELLGILYYRMRFFS